MQKRRDQIEQIEDEKKKQTKFRKKSIALIVCLSFRFVLFCFPFRIHMYIRNQ